MILHRGSPWVWWRCPRDEVARCFVLTARNLSCLAKRDQISLVEDGKQVPHAPRAMHIVGHHQNCGLMFGLLSQTKFIDIRRIEVGGYEFAHGEPGTKTRTCAFARIEVKRLIQCVQNCEC